MPRQKIELPLFVEYLSVLDEHGQLDEDLDPDIPSELLLKLHRAMLVGRRFDERLLNLQRQGRVGLSETCRSNFTALTHKDRRDRDRHFPYLGFEYRALPFGMSNFFFNDFITNIWP